MKTPLQKSCAQTHTSLKIMLKSLYNLIFIGLIATALFWPILEQDSGQGAAHNSNPLSTPKPIPPVAPSPPISVSHSPSTPSTSNTQPVDVFMLMIVWLFMAICFSIFLQKVGGATGVVENGAPSSVLKRLIREVEESTSQTRYDARAKAKAWLIDNVTALGENEIFLAKTHFSYLLPANWGAKASE